MHAVFRSPPCAAGRIAVSPGFHAETFEALEVAWIGSDQHEPMDIGDGGNLPIHKRGGPTDGFQARPFLSVPSGCCFVVRKDRK